VPSSLPRHTIIETQPVREALNALRTRLEGESVDYAELMILPEGLVRRFHRRLGLSARQPLVLRPNPLAEPFSRAVPSRRRGEDMRQAEHTHDERRYLGPTSTIGQVAA
jgi:hypothetical protein